MAEVVVYGTAQPAGSKRGFVVKGRVNIVDDNPKSRDWKTQVAQAAGEQWGGGMFEGAVVVEATFYRKRPAAHYGTGKNAAQLKPGAPAFPVVKPDATKLWRGTEDALTGIFWRDDSQVVKQHIAKAYGTPERCVVRAWSARAQDAADLGLAEPEPLGADQLKL